MWLPRWPGDNTIQTEQGLPHGTVLGCTSNGVVGYNCNYKYIVEENYDGSHFVDGVYLGMKWQCVEFARRYWLSEYNVIIPPVGFAAHIWNMNDVARRGDFYRVPLVKYPNGGSEKPVAGDLFIYASTPNQRVGHVAVVVDVVDVDGKTMVRVGEQNQENDLMWPGVTYADELEIVVTDGSFTITHPDPDLELVGWIRLNMDAARPRPEWVTPERVVQVNGVYCVETTKALQTMLGAFADGDHGGMTNTSIRNFLREMSSDGHSFASLSREDLLIFLRRFLVEHAVLSSEPGNTLTSLPDCNDTNCVCSAISPLKDRNLVEGNDKESEESNSSPCKTTIALQVFLNNIRHPHDIPQALKVLSNSA